MFVLNSSPGVIGTIVSGGGSLPFALAIGGNDAVPRFQGVTLAKGILTGFSYTGASGVGINHTLRDRIYAYVFGERIAPVTMSGYAFSGVCDNPLGRNYTGFEAVLSYYENVRASQQGTVCRVVLGPNVALAGLLSDFRFELQDAEAGVGTFSYQFMTFPRFSLPTQTPVLPWS